MQERGHSDSESFSSKVAMSGQYILLCCEQRQKPLYLPPGDKNNVDTRTCDKPEAHKTGIAPGVYLPEEFRCALRCGLHTTINTHNYRCAANVRVKAFTYRAMSGGACTTQSSSHISSHPASSSTAASRTTASHPSCPRLSILLCASRRISGHTILCSRLIFDGWPNT